ncbi:MAG: c-type cytochrome [Saprospiraceae bacterium]|nr:c-type cytochrome [Saprospiraceae bacterium]
MAILKQAFLLCALIFALISIGIQCTPPNQSLGQQVHSSDHIVLVGNNLCSRMMNFGHFETAMHVRFPDSLLFIRNMCDGGNTPGFRPHAGRESPWAFSGAASYQTELAKNSGSIGHFESPDEWLTRLKADVILAFFGYNESFRGEAGLANFKDELSAFVDHTLNQTYNSSSAPELVLISPIAFEDLSDGRDLPDGKEENANLQLYSSAIQEVAAAKQVPFFNVFDLSMNWYSESTEPLTIDGSQLTAEGYRKLAAALADGIFGTEKSAMQYKEQIHAAVQEKNWFWHNDYKIPNGVHVFGRRYKPFGPDNYPAELKKIRQMTAIRDEGIWKAAKGQQMDLAAADAETMELPPVPSNYKPSNKNGDPNYLYGEEALSELSVPPGYKIELFASERDFSDLANPVQLSFDDQGRLWVATMPSYPHYKPGDQKPNDKIIILEDTDGDGKADKQTTFADNLHLPIGFEIATEGVYISQGTNLELHTDTDGDEKADKIEILMSGFDDHDTHHAISAFCADPSGGIMMGEGVFLHTNVETSYGPVRGTNGGFYRFNPQRRQLERHAQLAIPNPWGIAFDEWGQHFFAETSGPDVRWMLPGSVKSRYGVATHKSFNIIEDAHRVRPTSGLEFVSSRHFPDEVQGDLLINNTIGFLGTKQHKVEDDGTGFKTTHRQDLVKGADKNFRPVDMEFAPDGSLYIIDWHNVLIGHMQHNARDPYRDHVHGRVYRVTYPSRPLVEPAKIAGASIERLLDNLKLPEYRSRYRTRRALRGKNADEVLAKLDTWLGGLDESDPRYEHHLLEGLFVSWGMNDVDQDLLKQLLQSDDFRVRAAVVRVLRYMGHQFDDLQELLLQAAADDHGRVRMEAIVAASWLDKAVGMPVVKKAGEAPLDDWLVHVHETAVAHLNDKSVVEQKDEEMVNTDLKGTDRDLFLKGKEIYSREGFCMTCHQAEGEGLSASGFPPLADTKWVLGSEERLIKLTLKGLMGPIEVLNKEYGGQVPMTPFGGMLNDEEVAAVLTYVRNSFGNKAKPVSAETVARIRRAIKDRTGFYSPEELLQEHPLENNEAL